jgi:DNA helicase-2/ATP-dependent DNA helicase PcrA
VSIEETVVDEAKRAALWLKQKLVPGETTAAMLFRTRSTQSHFIQALRDEDIPFHVLGIGGLLAEPEIADLVSALRVLNDPTAGGDLVRLLAGSRWRIGVRDLYLLRRVASWLQSRDYAHKLLDDDVKEQLRNSVADGEGGSIIDALDFIANARDGHSELERFSELGLSRLREAGKTFARLRQRASLDLLDFVTVVEQDFLLDIEVVANEHRPFGGANREAFFDALSSYLSVDDSATLGGFLAWLREAEWRDGLTPRPEEAEPGTVQLLTIHGSKGLEWDLVVVPRMVEDELPGKPREGFTGWLSFGSLPWEFRGDAAELPVLAWRGVSTRKELLDARADFMERVKHRHILEERRLAYVAVTRARHSLLLTGSFWAGQSKPRGASPFLRELEQAGVIGPLPAGSEFEENPLGDAVSMFSWPLDPLGSRRERVEAAASAVQTAVIGDAGRWEGELDLLLAERAARLTASERVVLPTRVPASRFKDFVEKPADVASSLRRPMPERPYRATRLGTLFHSWVENTYGLEGSSETLDSFATDLDDGEFASDDQLATLQATFESSQWATRKPIEVEREIHLVLDGQVIICKIDAVYLENGRYQVVDWKTGKAPRDAADLEAKQFQLALYRLAYAQWKGIDVDLIDAVFYFVADDAVIEPEKLFTEAELIARWRSSLGS